MNQKSKESPSRIRSLVELMKLEDIAINIISVLCGAMVALGGIPTIQLERVVLVLIGGSFGLSATIIVNQMFDVESDRINKPTRPLVSGGITLNQSYLIATSLYIGAFIIAIFLGYDFIILYSISFATSLAYSIPRIRLKDRFIVNSVILAIGYSFINFLIGWCIYKPLIQAPTWFMLLLFGFDVLDWSKDYRDVEGDRAAGSITIPVKLGVKKAAKVSLLLTQAYAGTIVVGSLVTSSFKINPWIFLGSYHSASTMAALFALTKEPTQKHAIWCYRLSTVNYVIFRVIATITKLSY